MNDFINSVLYWVMGVVIFLAIVCAPILWGRMFRSARNVTKPLPPVEQDDDAESWAERH